MIDELGTNSREPYVPSPHTHPHTARAARERTKNVLVQDNTRARTAQSKTNHCYVYCSFEPQLVIQHEYIELPRTTSVSLCRCSPLCAPPKKRGPVSTRHGSRRTSSLHNCQGVSIRVLFFESLLGLCAWLDRRPDLRAAER